MKKLLTIMESKGTMKSAEKAPTGPKFTGYWKGTDAATPGNKMVGGGAEEQEESVVPNMMKELKKVSEDMTVEQKLKEMWAQFNEEDLGVEPKRPSRKGARHPRGHEPHPRYKTVKTVKTDEAGSPAQQAAIAIAMKKAGKKPKNEGAMSEKDIELQDYRAMSHKEFQTAYGMTKTEWMNKNKSLVIQNPKIKQALGLEEGRAEVDKWAQAMYDTVEEIHGWAVAEQFEEIYYARDPQQLAELIDDNGLNINAVKAIYRTLKKFGPKDDYSDDWEHLTVWLEEYLSGEEQISEGAEQDPIVSKVVKQMRPGLTNLELSNEAFLYFAYELGKQRARDAWSDYLPAIRAEYEKGLNESADLKKQADKYTELAAKANKAGDDEKCKAFQKKVADIKKKMSKQVDESYYGPVEARWIVTLSDDEGQHLKTYHKKFPSLSAAKKAYKNTPYASDFKYKPVEKATTDESRGHKIIANKLKDIERAKNFRVPTPQERAELQKKLNALDKKKAVDEDGGATFGQPAPGQSSNTPGQTANTALSLTSISTDPGAIAKAQKQAQQTALATNTLTTAVNAKTGSPEKTVQALNHAMQGKPIDATDAKTLQPLIQNILGKAAQDPAKAKLLTAIVNKK